MFRKILFSALTVAIIAGAELAPSNALAYECWVYLVDTYDQPIIGATVWVRYHSPQTGDHGDFLMEDQGNGWYCDWRNFPPGWQQITHWRVGYMYISYAPVDPDTNPTDWMTLQPNSLTWLLCVSK